jgi:tight adherence protein C
LRALVVPLARRLDAPLRRLPVAPVDRLLRRAGVADMLCCSELLLLGLPFALLALPALLVGPRPAVGLLLLAAVVVFSAFRWLQRTAGLRERLVLRELPFHLDMLALALESGSTLLLALRSSTPRAPPGPLRDALDALALDLQAGRLRSDALAALQRRVDFDCITALTTAIREAERSGAGLARVLRIQADQRRHERFQYAEKRAMQAPVRMLGPLVLCIFPCTFIVIGFVLYVRVSG